MAGRTGRRSPLCLALVASAAVSLVLLTGCRAPNSMLRQRGFVALQQDNAVAAYEHFARAVQQDPTDWKAQYHMGKLLLQRDQAVEAQLALEQARSLRPADPETPRIIDALAEALYQQQRYESLHGLLAEATETFGASHDYLRQGEYLTRIGEIDGAKLAYLKAVEFADAADIKPHLQLARFYEQIGDRGTALDVWQKVYHMAPGNAAAVAKLHQYGVVPGPTVGAPPR